MSSRARGDHYRPYVRPWRPQRPATILPRRAEEHPQATGATDPVPASPDWSATTERRPESRTGWRAIVAIIVLIMAAAAYASDRKAPARTPVYPATPRAWLAAYRSAAVDNPSRVCSVLFTPELAARYRNTRPHSCTPSFSILNERRARIRRIVQSSGSAVIELRQTHPGHAWDVVLTRHGGGWQALELFSRQ